MAKPIQIITQLPTHFRFKDKADADEWNTTTTRWHRLEEFTQEITGRFEISSPSFAWVSFNNKDLQLEFCIK